MPDAEWTRPGGYGKVKPGERVRVKWLDYDKATGGMRESYRMGTVSHTKAETPGSGRLVGEGIGVELDDNGGFILVRCCDVERLKKKQPKRGLAEAR